MPHAVAAPIPSRSSSYRWTHEERLLEMAITVQGGTGRGWLLLPALSTISSRHEWQPFCDSIEERQAGCSEAPQLISVDWPGFGESERLHLAYDAELLARFLADFRRDCCPADCGLIAAGHAAGTALLSHDHQAIDCAVDDDWAIQVPIAAVPMTACAAGSGLSACPRSAGVWCG